jgi:predicted component of type VI protein secretion system
MRTSRFTVCLATALLLVTGCATSPPDESERDAIEADIQDILNLALGEDG